MVLLTPLLMLFLFLIVAAGRLVLARLEVESAAQQAARAASLARDPSAAAVAAAGAAQAALASQHITCDPLSASPDIGDFAPGGQVTVRVSCTVSLAGLGLLHLGSAETLTSTFASPIDLYRGSAP